MTVVVHEENLIVSQGQGQRASSTQRPQMRFLPLARPSWRRCLGFLLGLVLVMLPAADAIASDTLPPPTELPP
jgi:hypothetical protein